MECEFDYYEEDIPDRKTYANPFGENCDEIE